MAFKLESNEYIVLVARRHWFKPLCETFLLLFSFLIPIIFSTIIYALPYKNELFGNTSFLTLIVLVFWFFIVWNIAFVIWTNHFLDVLIVTNLHIIDIEQKGLWHREIATISLQKVQDISSKTEGIIQTMLNYGQIEIQSAGALNNFIVEKLQKPDLIRQKINEQMHGIFSVKD